MYLSQHPLTHNRPILHVGVKPYGKSYDEHFIPFTQRGIQWIIRTHQGPGQVKPGRKPPPIEFAEIFGMSGSSGNRDINCCVIESVPSACNRTKT